MKKYPISRRILTVLLPAALLLTGCKNSAPDASSVQEAHPVTEQNSADAPSETTAAADSAANADNSAAEKSESGADSAAKTEVSAAEPPKTDAPVFSAENLTVKPGDKHVPVTISLTNNPGFSFVGIRLEYDAALKAAVTDDEGTGELTSGDALNGMLAVCTVSKKKPMLAVSAASAADNVSDGALFTVYFDVPADAKPGTTYSLDGTIVSMYNAVQTELAAAPFTVRMTVA